jgi:tetratricopeptide (TPR) repeat protein
VSTGDDTRQPIGPSDHQPPIGPSLPDAHKECPGNSGNTGKTGKIDETGDNAMPPSAFIAEPDLDINASEPSLVTAADPSELSPIESAIMDVCNELHEARADNHADRIAELCAQADVLLVKYEASNAEDHPNPEWAVLNQRALVLSAAGKTRQAIDAERAALDHADTPRRKEISFGNLAERCVRAGLIDEALGYFLDAAEAAPNSVPVLVAGAQSLFLAGYRTEANRIFDELLTQARQRPAMLGHAGELGAYLRYEPRLRRLAPDLPALSALFGVLEGGQRD